MWVLDLYSLQSDGSVLNLHVCKIDPSQDTSHPPSPKQTIGLHEPSSPEEISGPELESTVSPLAQLLPSSDGNVGGQVLAVKAPTADGEDGQVNKTQLSR